MQNHFRRELKRFSQLEMFHLLSFCASVFLANQRPVQPPACLPASPLLSRKLGRERSGGGEPSWLHDGKPARSGGQKVHCPQLCRSSVCVGMRMAWSSPGLAAEQVFPGQKAVCSDPPWLLQSRHLGAGDRQSHFQSEQLCFGVGGEQWPHLAEGSTLVACLSLPQKPSCVRSPSLPGTQALLECLSWSVSSLCGPSTPLSPGCAVPCMGEGGM